MRVATMTGKFNGVAISRYVRLGGLTCARELTMRIDWQQLHALAHAEVQATLAALPKPLRDRARVLPVTFERRPNAAQRRDGIAEDTLGLFVGSEFPYEDTAALPLPPQIILFLHNLWDFAEADEKLFREEVHTTYLHELGHYLGLDDDDLFERGLE
jgi:predicted Zn-dependent protease with MMP-like domain